nr:chromatin assembly factor 1 subunit FAS1 [Tanacetum cinerariifolium]
MTTQFVKKSVKRKRAEVSISLEEREARISVLRDEIVALNKYYNEKFSGNDVIKNVDLVKGNAVIACLLEESRLSLSKLVQMVFDKVKESDVSVTVASVKSSVLLIGQRSFYGVQDLNADVLEDDSPSCLWCWETRDVKLLPKAVRGAVKIRRTCRKKIHERITAVSG